MFILTVSPLPKFGSGLTSDNGDKVGGDSPELLTRDGFHKRT